MSDDLLENLDMSKMSKEDRAQALEIEARAKELERTMSGHKDLGKLATQIMFIVAVLFGAFHLYTGAFGQFIALKQRSIHLAFAIIICMMKYSANKNMGADKEPYMPYIFLGVGFWSSFIVIIKSMGMDSTVMLIISFVVIFGGLFYARLLTARWRLKNDMAVDNRILWYDYLFMLFGVLGCSYIALFVDKIMMRAGIVTSIDQIMGFWLMLTVLEATRRSIGHTLMGIGIGMLIYSFFGNYFPGLFWHPGFDVSMIVRHFTMTTGGLWGTPLGVSASYISLFLLFGAALHASGLAEVLLTIAKGLFGSMVGGPAKMAVVASSLFAMVSGSSTSNVATTGVVTIPLMKRTGIPADLAGATEAAASMGGQITPPVMGAVAFIMAEFLGISYVTVMAAAALPAALYYIGVFTMVHFESCRIGAVGLKKADLPDWKKELLYRGYLIIPVFILVYMLISGYTPLMASFYAFWASCFLAMLKKSTRLNGKKFLHILSSAAMTLTIVAIPSAVAGFVEGTATLTGLPPRVAAALEIIAQDNLLLTLFITMITCLILGMGVPTVANYILMTILTVPIMIQSGVAPVAAHLFCFHFGIMSELTPPVAITSYTASAIAGAKFWPTAFKAVRLAAVAYIVPFLFVFNTELLLGQHPFSFTIVLGAVTAIIGAMLFGITMAGFFKRKMYWFERILMGGAAICMIDPAMITNIIGVTIFVAIFVFETVYKRAPKGYVPPVITVNDTAGPMGFGDGS